MKLFNKEEHNFSFVKVVGEFSGEYSLKEALTVCRINNMDLVVLNSEISPAICKILDYKDFINKSEYKKDKFTKTKVKQRKNIEIGSNIGENDIKTKINKIKELVENGHQVDVTIKYGSKNLRNEVLISNKERSANIIQKIIDEVKSKCSTIEEKEFKLFITLRKK